MQNQKFDVVKNGGGMDIGEIKELILVISGGVSLLSVAVGSLLALLQYRLKLKAEKRLAESSTSEMDIRLVREFSELMDIANGRGTSVLSERAVEEFFKLKIITEANLNDMDSIRSKLRAFAVFTMPVGGAAQDAAMAAIATLADKYEILREAAIQGLESAKSFKVEIAEKHLQRITSSGKNSVE